MFNKILVAIDDSTTSRKVFAAGLSLAKKTGASLMLLHVLSSKEKDDPSPFIYSDLKYNPNVETILEAYREQWQKFEQQGREFLQSLTEEANKAGVKTEFKQTFGYPGRKICSLAQTWSADLILVGSRGLTGLKEMFLGSISNYVTHHAPCSVLIVWEDADEVLSPKM
ncbi:MAG: universal stress protein [Xenococcaceae cyanobacterium]